MSRRDVQNERSRGMCDQTQFFTMIATQPSDECATISRNRERFSVRVPPTDITSCIHVGFRQSLVTIISLVLVVSDVPRTGITFSPQDYYARAGPGIVMYWGPFEYHVAHLKVDEAGGLNSTHPVIEASCDGNPLELLDLWPYKRDTLSIAPRAMAEYLNVTSYPRCVLYRGPCDASTLNPSTVFHMLDGLATAVQQRFFQDEHEHSPVAFFTKSNWVDRLHHFLFRFVTDNPDNRLHAVYHSSWRNDVPKHGDNFTRVPDYSTTHRYGSHSSKLCAVQFVCTNAVKWLCEHPAHSNGRRAIPIWEHIEARIEDLARQYPDLKLDLTMFATSFIEQTRREIEFVPSASYMTDTVEVTTVVRGRHCDASGNCATMFVDDYRYERSWIQGSEDQWFPYLWSLRGSAQLYVWVRVAALLCGCFSASKSESSTRRNHFTQRLKTAGNILVRIPGHAIVYGSWYPLILYALAHYFDSSLVQTLGEFAWSSVGGFYDFDLVQYTMTASMQMRNIWMIALLWKLMYACRALCIRGKSVNPARVGLLSFRGGWIGFVSWLTTFALMRALRFRDTAVVSITELPRHIPIESVRSMATYRNFVDYGPRFDLKCTMLGMSVVVGFIMLAKMTVRTVSGRGTALFSCWTHYIPLSAGRLWSWSILDGVWAIQLRDQSSRVHIDSVDSITPSAAQSTIKPLQSTVGGCRTCNFHSSALHWRATQGCPIHQPIFDVPRRTKAIWSMIRITNIAAMTDPIALFRLYVIGTPLYVYRVHDNLGTAPYLLLQPTPPQETTTAKGRNRRATWTAERSSKMEFMTTVDSRDVPWRALINCG